MKFTFALVFFLWLQQVSAQSSIRPAAEILSEAAQVATKEKKNILILFTASWCGWCKKMDQSIEDPICSRYFHDNYVIIHLTVFESEGKKHLEQPGSLDVIKRFKGEQSGIPFWVVLDQHLNLLADSYMRQQSEPKDQPGSNIGCPASEEEVAAFIEILKKTSALGSKELAVIAKRFQQNK